MKERLALWQHRAAFGSTVGPDGSLTQDEIDIGPDEATCYGCGLMLAFGDRRARVLEPMPYLRPRPGVQHGELPVYAVPDRAKRGHSPSRTERSPRAPVNRGPAQGWPQSMWIYCQCGRGQRVALTDAATTLSGIILPTE